MKTKKIFLFFILLSVLVSTVALGQQQQQQQQQQYNNNQQAYPQNLNQQTPQQQQQQYPPQQQQQQYPPQQQQQQYPPQQQQQQYPPPQQQQQQYPPPPPPPQQNQPIQEPTGTWATQPPTPPAPPPPPDTPAEQPQTENNSYLKWGFGISNHFAPSLATFYSWTQDAGSAVPGGGEQPPSPYYANIMFRTRLARKMNLNFMLGLGYYYFNNVGEDGADDQQWDGFLFQFGGRFLYSLVATERTDLYLGAGIGLLYGQVQGPGSDPSQTDYFTFMFQVPLGIEYSFESIPNLSISAEISFAVNYTKYNYNPTGDAPNDGAYLMAVGLGQTSESLLPLINYMSLGFTYWF